MLTEQDIAPYKHLFNSQDWKEYNKVFEGKPDHNRFLIDPIAKVFKSLVTTGTYRE